MDTASRSPALKIEVIERLESRSALEEFVKTQPDLQSIEIAEQLHAEILSGIVVDADRASRLARLVRWLAEFSGDEYILALADRCEGHVHYAAARYTAALRCYEMAAERFEHLGRTADVARTLTGALQSLIYLGLNDKALAYAERARLIFVTEGDGLRLARLDSNVGNIYYRQDRYLESLKFYQRALDGLVAMNRHRDAAAVLSNMAVASTGMGEFQQAAEHYARSREIAEREGLSAVSAQSDYNIAYFYFLRGDHTRALDLYREAQRHSAAAGDEYHSALCDLDRAEVYLELNLINESANLSRQAASRFERLEMTYERAKALTFRGIAEHSRHNTRRALVVFAQARRLFAEAPNPIWRAILDFYRSILLNDLGHAGSALKIAARAEHIFDSEALPHRSALVKLLKAEILIEEGSLTRAFHCVQSATAGLRSADHPVVFFHSEYLAGRILKLQNEPYQARAAFASAAERLESIRCRLAGDDLKVAFVRDKLDVYSQLVALSQAMLPVQESAAAVFEFIEKSKSRSLAERVSYLQTDSPMSTAASVEFSRVREKLNALYREINSRETDRRSAVNLKDRVQALELRLSELLREQPFNEREVARAADWTPVSLHQAAEALPEGAQILEYFASEERLWVGVIGKNGTVFKDLGTIERVYSAARLLTFQISRPQNQKPVSGSTDLAQAATLRHLQALYSMLIQPIEQYINFSDLVIVPHRLLHCLPFHALNDGSSYLIDRCTITYAPSATVFCLCKQKLQKGPSRSLILGVPDEKSPAITSEIEHVAKLLPVPSVFSRGEATVAALFENAASSRYIHIAAHGEFRSDNPMFSSVRLADGQVRVVDLYRLQLNAELVTLSGCSTGAGLVVAGDELVGLARGLMYAGTRTVLLALWEVHDPTTAILMRHFYENLSSGKHCAAALREAMLELKQDRPQPYYWAPFVLSGYAFRQGPL